MVFFCWGNSDPELAAALKNTRKIDERAKADFKQKQKVIQLLLLGTGESGKSTISKQMRIIHINGFSDSERAEKVTYMRKNIRDSMACIAAAMDKLSISFDNNDNREQALWLLDKMADNAEFNAASASQDPFEYTPQFFDVVETLWRDSGIQKCFHNSHHYQLIDCAKYFLDRTSLFRDAHYSPSDQDILRCRIMTNDITDIQFQIRDGHHRAIFRVFDVGGQKGERKKWIQCFNSVTAILYIADVSSFDLTLKEDVGTARPKNRLLESLDTFQEVWLNRFLQDVSILLFINKIDLLDEKVRLGKSLEAMLEYCRADLKLEEETTGTPDNNDTDSNDNTSSRRRKTSDMLPPPALRPDKIKKKNAGPVDLRSFILQFDFDEFQPSDKEKSEFLQSFPRLSDTESTTVANGNHNNNNNNNHVSASQQGKQKSGKRKQSEPPDVHPDTIRTACFVKNIFMELTKRKPVTENKYDFHHHNCCYYYTCAVNTDNIKKVLDGCRAFIIDRHLERFGIL